ncbi:MAG TPA: arylesterase [Gammaproteobacteria bacterium]|nr:arylesterase [Gammaproteobacteria bacterium]
MVVCFDLAMLNRILLLLIMILPGTAPAGIILVVGDSLSAAYGMPLEQGWVSLLQERLDTAGYPFRIVNASISGDTTANARARLPEALASHAPAVVLLELGGNDGLRGLSLASMRSNLADMISSTHEAGAKLLLVGVQLPPNYGPRYTERFQAVYHELAQVFDLTLLPSLVDGIGTEQDLMQADGIHPNAAAQPLIRDRVWEALAPLLEPADPGRPAMPENR